ncbi:uncharacterized protein BcabD6B2_53030 [Babesia caballi]|uniref:Transmembrane protein, putative n=1 Tax=Babesia caballi TaxID=5871 RepID=A0AAV4M1J7_BABCB|nr:transmembrane protein, putative [Babesia caballi]
MFSFKLRPPKRYFFRTAVLRFQAGHGRPRSRLAAQISSDFYRSPCSFNRSLWEREFESHRRRLKSRCKNLKETFCADPRTSPQLPGNRHSRRPANKDKTRPPPAYYDPHSAWNDGYHERSRETTRPNEDQEPSCTATPVRSTHDSRATPASRANVDRCAELQDSRSSPGLHCNPFHGNGSSNGTSNIDSRRRHSSCSSLPPRVKGPTPLDLLLACKLGFGTSTASYGRPVNLIDRTERPFRVKRNLHQKPRRHNSFSRLTKAYCPGDASSIRSRSEICDTTRNWPLYSSRFRTSRLRAPSDYSNLKSHYSVYQQDQPTASLSPAANAHWIPDTPRYPGHRNHKGRKALHREHSHHHRTKPRQLRRNHPVTTHYCHRCSRMGKGTCARSDDTDVCTSIDEADCLSSKYSEGDAFSKAHHAHRAMNAQMKVDEKFVDRMLSGHNVSMDLVRAPEHGSSETDRYIMSICREVFTGAIGGQLVYVVTSLIFGNVAAAIIVLLLCVQSAFCHCDGRPVAYVINGVLSILVGSIVTMALCRSVSGLEVYRDDPVLNTMSYIYVPLCFAFGGFSFFLAHSNRNLQKRERRAIVEAVNRLVGDRYHMNERSLALERRM